MNTNYTAEEILDRIFYKPEQSDWYKPLLKAMEEYATQAAAPELPKGIGYQEVASEAIQNALYATGKFTPDDCDTLCDGIVQYLSDAGLSFCKPLPYAPAPASDEEIEKMAERQVKIEGWGEWEGLSEQTAIKNSFIAGYKAATATTK